MFSQSKTATDTSNIRNDTSIVKNTFDGELTVRNTSNDYFGSFLLQLLPYIIALAGVGISAYSLFNQRTITQKQINVETKRKLINDLMEVNKKVNLIIFETFKISHEVLANIPNEITTKENLKEAREKIDLAMRKMDDKYMELMYWSATVLLYISKTHPEHNNLKKLSTKLSKSYTNYHLYFNGSEIPIKEKENKLGDILQKRLGYYSDKIEELIDAERNNIDNIFKIKS